MIKCEKKIDVLCYIAEYQVDKNDVMELHFVFNLIFFPWYKKYSL